MKYTYREHLPYEEPIAQSFIHEGREFTLPLSIEYRYEAEYQFKTEETLVKRIRYTVESFKYDENYIWGSGKIKFTGRRSWYNADPEEITLEKFLNLVNDQDDYNLRGVLSINDKRSIIQ